MYPKWRMVVYVLVAGMLPVFAVGSWYLGRARALGELEERIYTVCRRTALKERRGQGNARVRAQYAGADHRYIDKELESLVLQRGEAEELKRLVADEPTLPSREVAERLKFLEGNRLLFSEMAVESYAGVEERLEQLVGPVEVDGEDLGVILERVEGEGEGRPLMIVTDLRLQRKRISGDNEAFSLEMKVLKREFS